MTDNDDEYGRLLEQKRFLGEIEQGTRLANREIIRKRIPHLGKETILDFAVAVGRLRAAYLEAALALGVDESGTPPDGKVIAELRAKREMYEEARMGFEALTAGIERGYIEIGEME